MSKFKWYQCFILYTIHIPSINDIVSSFVDPKLLRSVTGRYGWVRLARLKLGQDFVIFKSSSHIAGGLLSMPSHLQSRCSSRLHLQSSFRVPDSLINHPHVSYNQCNFTLISVWIVRTQNARTHSWRMEDDCFVKDARKWTLRILPNDVLWTKKHNAAWDKMGHGRCRRPSSGRAPGNLMNWLTPLELPPKIRKPNCNCKSFQSQGHATVYTNLSSVCGELIPGHIAKRICQFGSTIQCHSLKPNSLPEKT